METEFKYGDGIKWNRHDESKNYNIKEANTIVMAHFFFYIKI